MAAKVPKQINKVLNRFGYEVGKVAPPEAPSSGIAAAPPALPAEPTEPKEQEPEPEPKPNPKPKEQTSATFDVKVEQRVEVGRQIEPDYSAVTITEQDVESGKHRRFVGGMWNEIGAHQLKFLTDQGLRPDMRFLDVGCGSLRAGIHLVRYLDPGNYYGIDINPVLIEAGYNVELDQEGRDRLPISNLHSTDRFDANFGVEFDFAIANSVFTHVPLNHVRLCLYRIGQAMKSGGVFFTTIFERQPDFPVDGFYGKHPRRHYTERNVFWHYPDDLRWAAEKTPLEYEYIGDWGHPRGQKMIKFTRR